MAFLNFINFSLLQNRFNYNVMSKKVANTKPGFVGPAGGIFMESIKETKSVDEKVRNALSALLTKKDFDHIFVKDICKESGINRSTFYDHYQDINDLLIKTEVAMVNSLCDIFSYKTLYSKENFIAYFRFVEENKDFYKAFFEHHFQPSILKSSFEEYIIMANNQSSHVMTINEMTYHQAFWGGGLLAITKEWLLSGAKETPERMAEMILNEYHLYLSFQ